MTGHLADADLHRMARRLGMAAAPPPSRPGPVRRRPAPRDEPALLVPARLDLAALRAPARPARCRRCCAAWSAPRRGRAAAGRRATDSPPAQQLAGLAAAERRRGAAGPGPRRTPPPSSATPAPTRRRRDRAFKRPRLRLADRGRAAQPARRGRPACGCPPPSSSTTRPPAALAGSPASTDRLGDGRRRRPAAAPAPSRSPTTSRSRSSAMACRYPGGVGSPEDLWRAGGRRARTRSAPFPDRPRLGPRRACTTPTPTSRAPPTPASGGFLHDAGEFDAEFFGICPREALAMDPQQRLLLETSLGGVRAGRASTRPSLRGSRTGVFAGVMYHDYGARLHGRRPTGSRATSDRHTRQRRLRPGRLHLRAGGPGGHRRHRLLLLAGRAAPGRPGAARRASARWRWPAA